MEKIKKFINDHPVLCETILGIGLLFGGCKLSFKAGEKSGKIVQLFKTEEILAMAKTNAYCEGYENGFKSAMSKEDK